MLTKHLNIGELLTNGKNSDNGEDFFIKRDLPDIYDKVMKKVTEQVPKIWDERIMNYIDQINLITADEIYFKVLEEE